MRVLAAPVSFMGVQGGGNLREKQVRTVREERFDNDDKKMTNNCEIGGSQQR